MADNRQFPAGNERQERVEELFEQGYSLAEAIGSARAEEAGFTRPAVHGVDPPSTRLERDGKGS